MPESVEKFDTTPKITTAFKTWCEHPLGETEHTGLFVQFGHDESYEIDQQDYEMAAQDWAENYDETEAFTNDERIAKRTAEVDQDPCVVSVRKVVDGPDADKEPIFKFKVTGEVTYSTEKMD